MNIKITPVTEMTFWNHYVNGRTLYVVRTINGTAVIQTLQLRDFYIERMQEDGEIFIVSKDGYPVNGSLKESLKDIGIIPNIYNEWKTFSSVGDAEIYQAYLNSQYS